MKNSGMDRRLICDEPFQEGSDKLVELLNTKKGQWKCVLTRHEEEKSETIGICLLAASFLSYAGPFTPKFREKMVFDDWLADIRARQIPISQQCDIIDVLCTMEERFG